MTTQGKKRNGHGEGTYKQLPSGRWEWRISAKVRGVHKRLSGTEDTLKQARAAAHRAKVSAEAGKVAVNRAVTLGAFLDGWHTALDGVSESTRKKYEDLIRLHIRPRVGAVKLAAVTPALLREFYAELREDANLGYSSRRQVHNILHAALGQAAADDLIPGNPAAVPGVRPVQAAREVERVRAFTPLEAAKFLAAATAEGERTGQVLAFLLLTGMRRGEALYLRWASVNLSGKVPAVRVEGSRSVSGARVFEGPPKTKHGRRLVPLSPDAVVMLERVRERIAEEREALYPDAPPSPYVFASLKGGPYDPSNFTRVMERICKAAKVPRLAVHDLRHSFASLSAAQGVRVEVLSRIMGHASPAFTLTQYRHLYPEELQAVSLQLPSLEPDAMPQEDIEVEHSPPRQASRRGLRA